MITTNNHLAKTRGQLGYLTLNKTQPVLTLYDIFKRDDRPIRKNRRYRLI